MRLLSLALCREDPVAPASARERAVVDWMSRPCPGSGERPDAKLQMLLRVIRHETSPCTSVGDRVLGRQSSLAGILAVKGMAKQSCQTLPTGVDRDAAVVIYYAAIASARLRHRVWITSHGDNYLLDAFQMLSKKIWIPEALRVHFAEAAASCA